MNTSCQCPKCKKGFMVSEYSSNEKRTNYYCNHCFKYATESELTTLNLLRRPDSSLPSWDDLTEEEIDRFLGDIFKQ